MCASDSSVLSDSATCKLVLVPFEYPHSLEDSTAERVLLDSLFIALPKCPPTCNPLLQNAHFPFSHCYHADFLLSIFCTLVHETCREVLSAAVSLSVILSTLLRIVFSSIRPELILTTRQKSNIEHQYLVERCDSHSARVAAREQDSPSENAVLHEGSKSLRTSPLYDRVSFPWLISPSSCLERAQAP